MALCVLFNTIDIKLPARPAYLKHAGQFTPCRMGTPADQRRSASGAGLGGEIFVELVSLALMLVGVGRLLTLAGDIGPFGGEFRVEFQPFLKAVLGVGRNGLNRAFVLADAAID